MRLALYQPEIPQNTGTLLRLGACFNVEIDIIEPCSFALSDRRLKRAGLDYGNKAIVNRHSSWQAFQNNTQGKRLILLSPQGSTSYLDYTYSPQDILMVGQESTGVPASVYEHTDAQVYIPMHPTCRSINVAIAAGIVLGEALRQTQGFYKGDKDVSIDR